MNMNTINQSRMKRLINISTLCLKIDEPDIYFHSNTLNNEYNECKKIYKESNKKIYDLDIKHKIFAKIFFINKKFAYKIGKLVYGGQYEKNIANKNVSK